MAKNSGFLNNLTRGEAEKVAEHVAKRILSGEREALGQILVRPNLMEMKKMQKDIDGCGANTGQLLPPLW